MKSINENRFLRLEAYFGKEKVNDLSKKKIAFQSFTKDSTSLSIG